MPQDRVLVVGEIGINWNGDSHLLRELIFRAKDCGADIAKTQLYSPVKLFPDKQVIAQGRNWYEEVARTEMSKEMLQQFFQWCKEAEIEPLGSAFDSERLGWLEELEVKRHKIASRTFRFDADYCSKVFALGKETFVSLGMVPIKGPWPILVPFRENVRFLYCVSEYPTPLSHIRFPNFSSEIGGIYGVSSHYPGIEPGLLAIAHGAKLVEVHFCLSRVIQYGPDISCSLEPNELKNLVRIAGLFEQML